MNTNIQAEFFALQTKISQTALELLEKKSYDNVTELLTDCLNLVAEKIQEDVKNVKKPKFSVISGVVGKRSAMIEIEEGQGLPIFGEENNE